MRAEDILNLIPILRTIEKDDDIKKIKTAIKSCVVVQELEKAANLTESN